MSKAWLIGFTEAEGSFYLVKNSTNRLVHAFEIKKNLDKIVLIAIKYILGISTKVQTKEKGYFSISTTNSRAIENIIKYFSNTMKGIKSLEYKIWSRSYKKIKSNPDNIQNLYKINKLLSNLSYKFNYNNKFPLSKISNTFSKIL
jgi:hypothetical protein